MTGVDFLAHKEPGAEAPGRHRRVQLPCSHDLSTHLLTLAEARAALDATLRDLRHQAARAAGDLHDWLVWLDLEGKRPKTIYQYHRQVAPLLRAYPELAFQEFTNTHINTVLQQVPPRSRHITRSIYNKWFEWGMEDPAGDGFRLNRDPMRGVPKPKQPRRRPSDVFTEGEVAALEGLPIPDGPLWAILFGSGIRRTIARRLRRSHIDLNRGRMIAYDDKGGVDRVIPLPTSVLAAVADLDLFEQLGPDDHLWYTRRGQRRLRRDPISSTAFARGPNAERPGWYERGLRDAGVRYLNPHQTRHTYGHWLREVRVDGEPLDLEERRLLMGHISIRTTADQYGHVTIEDVARKVAAL